MRCHAYIVVEVQDNSMAMITALREGGERRDRSPLVVVVSSPDRGNAGIIRTGRVNGLSNTPLSDLP